MRGQPFNNNNTTSKMLPKCKLNQLQRTYNQPSLSQRITTCYIDYQQFKEKTFCIIQNRVRPNQISIFSRKAKLPPCSLSSKKELSLLSSTTRKRKSSNQAKANVLANSLSFTQPPVPHLSKLQNTACSFLSPTTYLRKPYNKLLRKTINSQNLILKKLRSLSTSPASKKPTSPTIHIH